jgi:preprotein translocase subunit SecY
MLYTRNMGDLGRMLVFFGGILLVVGLIFILAGKVNLPIGRLPGDMVYRGKHTTFYFPLMTSILLSVILSLVLYFVNRMR